MLLSGLNWINRLLTFNNSNHTPNKERGQQIGCICLGNKAGIPFISNPTGATVSSPLSPSFLFFSPRLSRDRLELYLFSSSFLNFHFSKKRHVFFIPFSRFSLRSSPRSRRGVKRLDRSVVGALFYFYFSTYVFNFFIFLFFFFLIVTLRILFFFTFFFQRVFIPNFCLKTKNSVINHSLRKFMIKSRNP